MNKETDLFDDEDEEILTADNDESSKKSRKKPGKRAIYFHCAGNVILFKDLPSRKLSAGQTALIMEMIEVSKPGEDEVLDLSSAAKEAKEKFRQMYGNDPELIGVPVALYKGAQQVSKKREALTVAIEKNECRFLPTRAEGVMKVKGIDWKVVFNYTADPKIVLVFFGEPLNFSGKKPIAPKHDFFSIDQIRDIKELQENTQTVNN